MIARARCGKCGEIGKFDVGAVTTVEGAQARLDASHIQSCPFGHHIELSDIRFEVIDLEEGQAPSDDEWLTNMRETRDLWTTDELRLTEIRITGFAFGFPMAEVRGNDFWLGMMTSPEGHRFYFAETGAYAEAVGRD